MEFYWSILPVNAMIMLGGYEIIITITAIMIKRNAERNVLNDKYAFKYRTKQYDEECLDGRQENRRMDLDLSHDENGRLTSNNKKYHQYKEEKEMRHRKIEVKNESKSTVPLAEIRAEQNYTPPLSKERGLLKRQYQYEANDKVQEKQPETRSIAMPKQSERKNTSTQHNYSFNQINHQPLCRRVESQSIQKEIRPNERINTKFVRPSLDADVFSTERKYERRSYQKLNYNLSQNIKLARDYEKLDEPTDRTNNFTPLRQQITPTLTQYRLQSSLGAEQMSLKLKQISSFNDEINQRIKSIIGSFMSLKEKL